MITLYITLAIIAWLSCGLLAAYLLPKVFERDIYLDDVLGFVLCGFVGLVVTLAIMTPRITIFDKVVFKYKKEKTK